MLCLPLPRRSRLLAMCLMVAKFAGAWALRMRHSSSRNTMSITQCSPFSTPQWLRTGSRVRHGDETEPDPVGLLMATGPAVGMVRVRMPARH